LWEVLTGLDGRAGRAGRAGHAGHAVVQVEGYILIGRYLNNLDYINLLNYLAAELGIKISLTVNFINHGYH
jgi:hypothetical protein